MLWYHLSTLLRSLPWLFQTLFCLKNIDLHTGTTLHTCIDQLSQPSVSTFTTILIRHVGSDPGPVFWFHSLKYSVSSQSTMRVVKHHNHNTARNTGYKNYYTNRQVQSNAALLASWFNQFLRQFPNHTRSNRSNQQTSDSFYPIWGWFVSLANHLSTNKTYYQ